MKKVLFSLCAMLLCMTACQKEEVDLTVRAELPAELVDGETFNRIIKELDGTDMRPDEEEIRSIFVRDDSVRTIQFQCNSDLTSETLVSISNSTPIYASWNAAEKTITISTPASSINANANSGSMFRYLRALQSIDNLDVLNTENVTNMSDMFAFCGVPSLDLSCFNTSNVTNMSHMFSYCNVSSLALPSFNTSNVRDMSYMFYSCQNLQSVDVSNFNTENVMSMSNMFCECHSLTSLDISKFSTNSVMDMNALVRGCWSMGNLNLGSNFVVKGTIDHICYDLARAVTSCTITCSEATKTALVNTQHWPGEQYGTNWIWNIL